MLLLSKGELFVMHKALIESYRRHAALCKVHAAGNRNISPKRTLQHLVDNMTESEASDQYGQGALIEGFEQEIASLLGKQSALFMPSGTMAQNIALKIWAQTRQSNDVAMHPTSHLLLHEQNAVQALYQLNPITVGEAHQVPRLEEIKAAALKPLAAVLLEIPMREIGGQLPDWGDLVAQSEWLRSQEIPLHMDGARLWQCPPAYNKSLAEIAALFDSIYVSFYKDMGGISGACLVGDHDFIAEAKIWLRRAGGNLYSLYPYVVSAREGLKTHLPQMQQRKDDAHWLAAQLNKVECISTWPIVPHTSMFRLRVNANAVDFLNRSIEWMRTRGICLIRTPYQTSEHNLMAELSIGDGFAQLDRSEWQDAIDDFAKLVLKT
jgi:threonine aldolase